MKTLDYIALTLVIIGAVNWGLIGFFRLEPCCCTLWQHELVIPYHLCNSRSLRSLLNFHVYENWNRRRCSII